MAMTEEPNYYIPEDKDDVSILRRVCHISLNRSATDRRVFYKECLTLADAGFEVSYIVVNQDITNESPINLSSVNIAKRRLFFNKRANKALFKKALSIHAEIYHIHEPALLPTALKLKEYGKRVIYGMHQDLENFKMTYHWSPKFLRKFFIGQSIQKEKLSIAQLDGIITDTPWLRKKMIAVHSIVVDACDFPRMEDYPNNLFQKESSNLACYSNLDRSTHAKNLVEAIGLVDKDCQLIGKVRGKNLRKLLQKLPGWSHLIELGKIGIEARKNVFAQSKIGIIADRKNLYNQEKISSQLFEFLAAGIPIIAPNFEPTRKLLKEHKVGKFIDTSDTNDYKKAIDYFYHNQNELVQYSKNARQAFEIDFNWKNEAKKYLIMYRKIASKEKYGYS